MMRPKPRQTLAIRIVDFLGAYMPRVRQFDPEIMDKAMADAKRRKRPMTGRGNYGKNLKAHFDTVNFNKWLVKQSKKG